MTADLTQILESERALRRELAGTPVAEKLRMLEAMRERDVAIRPGSARTGPPPVNRQAKSR
ncbi:MAG TPA: hypothetical protein VE974_04590 [Thermoanaerobaculia bacterium]|nr:hypothetical protein [Thermoanaerobaculia bacterium]